MENILKDFIVIGGGMAGVCAAIYAAHNCQEVTSTCICAAPDPYFT